MGLAQWVLLLIDVNHVLVFPKSNLANVDFIIVKVEGILKCIILVLVKYLHVLSQLVFRGGILLLVFHNVDKTL